MESQTSSGSGQQHFRSRDEGEEAAFRVLIAPQSENQLARINDLLGKCPLHGEAGGRGVTVGAFHTREYADTICTEYRDLGFFCVVTDEHIQPA